MNEPNLPMTLNSTGREADIVPLPSLELPVNSHGVAKRKTRSAAIAPIGGSSVGGVRRVGYVHYLPCLRWWRLTLPIVPYG